MKTLASQKSLNAPAIRDATNGPSKTIARRHAVAVGSCRRSIATVAAVSVFERAGHSVDDEVKEQCCDAGGQDEALR